jgi:hypothetical protein
MASYSSTVCLIVLCWALTMTISRSDELSKLNTPLLQVVKHTHDYTPPK